LLSVLCAEIKDKSILQRAKIHSGKVGIEYSLVSVTYQMSLSIGWHSWMSWVRFRCRSLALPWFFSVFQWRVVV